MVKDVVEVYFTESRSCCGSCACAPPEEMFVDSVKELSDQVIVRSINVLDANVEEICSCATELLKKRGVNVLPIVVVNHKVIGAGKLPSVADVLSALNESKANTSKFVQITPTRFLWHNKTYKMQAPQCCSTTYFCACSSS